MTLTTPSALHIDDLGEGEPVLLLHSSGLSGRQWRRLVPELVKRGMRAVVPDLTGHGQSEPWPEPTPFSFRTDVDRVGEVLRTLGAAHVVGHSYGGLVGLHAAVASPAAIRSLTLYEPVAFGVLDVAEDADARATLDGVEMSWGEAIRGARVTSIPGIGHLGPVANADLVNPLLLDAIATRPNVNRRSDPTRVTSRPFSCAPATRPQPFRAKIRPNT